MKNKQKKYTTLPESRSKSAVHPEAFAERTLESEDGWAPEYDETPLVLVPDGVYQAMCFHSTSFWHRGFKRRVIQLNFKVVDGEFFGIRLARYYAGVEKVGRGSAYFREYVIADGGLVPRRRDRLSLLKFRKKVFHVRTRTVANTRNGSSYPSSLRYSVVDAILELVTTNEAIPSSGSIFLQPAHSALVTDASAGSRKTGVGAW